MPNNFIIRGAGGRQKPHEKTPRLAEQVKRMAGFGIKVDDIAKVLVMGEHTIREHYREELEIGRIDAIHQVSKALFRYATDPTHRQAVVACIFWLKNRAGWKDVVDQQINVSGGIDAPPRPESVDEWLTRRKAELDEKRTVTLPPSDVTALN